MQQARGRLAAGLAHAVVVELSLQVLERLDVSREALRANLAPESTHLFALLADQAAGVYRCHQRCGRRDCRRGGPHPNDGPPGHAAEPPDTAPAKSPSWRSHRQAGQPHAWSFSRTLSADASACIVKR
jgi:hypothetical protein